MLKLIKRFAATPFSGYLSIGLIIAAAGAGYWFWTELKEFGGLEQEAANQAAKIAEQKQEIDTLTALSVAKGEALTRQANRTAQLEYNARVQQLAVEEAIKHADKVTRECMSLHLADGLQFGPSREDEDSSSQARSDVDG